MYALVQRASFLPVCPTSNECLKIQLTFWFDHIYTVALTNSFPLSTSLSRQSWKEKKIWIVQILKLNQTMWFLLCLHKMNHGRKQQIAEILMSVMRAGEGAAIEISKHLHKQKKLLIVSLRLHSKTKTINHKTLSRFTSACLIHYLHSYFSHSKYKERHDDCIVAPSCGILSQMLPLFLKIRYRHT